MKWKWGDVWYNLVSHSFSISLKKTSSSSSYFTSPSFVFTFILFYPSIVWFFFWGLCVSMNKINFWWWFSISFFFSTGFKFNINVRIHKFLISFYFRKLNCKSHMSILFVYMTCVNMSRAWNTPTHFINNFWYVLLKMDSVCFAIPIKEIKRKWKLRRRKKNKKFLVRKIVWTKKKF